MKRLSLLVAGMFLFVGVTQNHARAEITKHYEGSIFSLTQEGHFGVELLIHDGELKAGTNRMDVIIHDNQDRDVPGAGISVIPWMPEMGHGVSDVPLVEERGGGLYTVENVVLPVAGKWELRIGVSAAGHEDKVVFEFPEVEDVRHGRGHRMHAGHDKAMEGEYDSDGPGADVNSLGGIFIASYESEPAEIPMNRIHRWILTLKTPEGEPVRKAEIMVAGEMPAHGHGLPTHPEVVEELEGGRYVIEGMKFNMPGFWIVTFHVKAEQGEDDVRLALRLR